MSYGRGRRGPADGPHNSQGFVYDWRFLNAVMSLSSARDRFNTHADALHDFLEKHPEERPSKREMQYEPPEKLLDRIIDRMNVEARRQANLDRVAEENLKNLPLAYGIRAVGFSTDAAIPCPHAGQWLEKFDFDAYQGRGFGTFTSRASHAMRFATPGDAMTFRKRRSRVRPTRPDGQPNRPLTALTVQIEPLT